MTDDLAKKRRVRGAHKASTTKIMTQISELVGSEHPNQAKLVCLRLALNEKLEVIKALDTEVIELIQDDRLDAISALLSVDHLLKRLNPTPVTTTASVREPSTHASSYASHTKVKLPKLQLRSFSGDLTHWMSFWDSFQTAVHNNEQLSNIEKFNYLNSLLEHTAREYISGFALTAANYQQAVALLKKRFGCKQKIVNKNLEALFNVVPVTGGNNVRASRCLFDAIISHV